ncbi:MAG TPA: prepilin-type N-terminal cleavage/methylation domain-containing protein [Kofleriaceae bacterium]|nr:prepilin-type N-terminal cleavage/methylation domain-containing protein [Kofleriaceae bacterium]
MAAATTPGSPARARRGFTLLEVMFGLALLGLGLTVLIKSAAGDIFNAQQAHMIGVVTDLARGKMYDIEEKLLHDGFSDTEQHEDDQSFSDEGWPQIHYSYKVELVELPGFEQLQAIIAGTGSGSGRGSAGSGSGDEASGGFENSMLGGMMAQFGGLGGGAAAGKGSADVNSSIGGAFIQSQYTMFQQILKVTIRKVTLTVNYQVMGSDRDLKVVQFLTDAAAMDKVLNGLGSQDLPAAGSGSGSGSGSGPKKPGP